MKDIKTEEGKSRLDYVTRIAQEHGDPPPLRTWCKVIDGAMAAAIMENARKNVRGQSLRHERKLAEDMISGRWKRNGDTIALDKDMRLVNGQTRVRAAIIAAQRIPGFRVALDFVVIDESTNDTKDTGRSLLLHHIAQQMGVANAEHVTPIGRALYILRGKAGAWTWTISGVKSTVRRVTHDEVVREIKDRLEPEISTALALAVPAAKQARVSPTFVALALCEIARVRGGWDDIRAFSADASAASGLFKTEAALMWFKNLINQRHSHGRSAPAQQVYNVTVRAMRNFIAGGEAKFIKGNGDADVDGLLSGLPGPVNAAWWNAGIFPVSEG